MWQIIFSQALVILAINFSGYSLDIFNAHEFVLIDQIIGWTLIWVAIAFYTWVLNKTR